MTFLLHARIPLEAVHLRRFGEPVRGIRSATWETGKEEMTLGTRGDSGNALPQLYFRCMALRI